MIRFSITFPSKGLSLLIESIFSPPVLLRKILTVSVLSKTNPAFLSYFSYLITEASFTLISMSRPENSSCFAAVLAFRIAPSVVVFAKENSGI